MNTTQEESNVRQVPCENCGHQPLQRYPTVQSIMWYCPRCRLYQKGQAYSGEQYNMDYHSKQGYVANGAHKLRSSLCRLSRVAGLLESKRPRFLDIGCSLGYAVEAGVKLGWDAHGVDLSSQAVEICRDRGLNCQWVAGETLPYPDGYFDLVTAWHVIEHVPDVATTLREWSRVLKPGGVLVMETPDASCLKLKLRGGGFRNFWCPDHVYTFRHENLVPFVESAHLEVVPPPMLGRLDQLPPSLVACSIGYLIINNLKYWTGLSKIFQVHCRRTQADTAALTKRTAA